MLGRRLVSEFQHGTAPADRVQTLASTSSRKRRILAMTALGGVAAKAEIDRDDAEIAERPQIGDDRRVVAGAEPPVAIVGLAPGSPGRAG